MNFSSWYNLQNVLVFFKAVNLELFNFLLQIIPSFRRLTSVHDFPICIYLSLCLYCVFPSFSTLFPFLSVFLFLFSRSLSLCLSLYLYLSLSLSLSCCRLLLKSIPSVTNFVSHKRNYFLYLGPQPIANTQKNNAHKSLSAPLLSASSNSIISRAITEIAVAFCIDGTRESGQTKVPYGWPRRPEYICTLSVQYRQKRWRMT